jgi:4-amino-4-deoxy-L-arabinose transferase-like glycosyltransferase
VLERLGRLSLPTQRLLLLLGCILLFALWLSWVPITERDETRYAEATREMLASGDFIIPSFNFEPRFQKPVLFYWLQAPFIKLFGVNEVAARLPSAVMSLLLVLLVHGALFTWLPAGAAGDYARLRARGAAFLGAAALAVMPLVAIWARSAVTDPTLTLFITAGLLALLQADVIGAAEPRNAHRWYYVAAVAAGLAFLTKGPVGVLIPAITWLLYHISRQSLGVEVRRVPWLGAILLFLLVAVPWYAATYFVNGPGFLARFFLVENAQRFAGAMEGHGFGNRFLSLFVYLPVAWLFCYPVSPFLVRDLLQPFGGNPAIARQDLYARLRRFAWCWVAATLLLFSPAATKLPSYILPLAAAVALLFALHLIGRLAPGTTMAEPSRRAKVGAVLEIVLLVLPALLWAGGPIAALLKGTVEGPFGSQAFPHPLTEILIGLLAVPGLVLLGMLAVWSLRRKPARLIAWTLGSWSVLLAVLLLGVAPVVIRAAYAPSVEIGRFLREQSSAYTVFTYKDGRLETGESLVYYARRRVRFLERGDAQASMILMRLLDQHRSMLLVTDDAGYLAVKSLGKSSVLKRVGRFQVVKLEPFVAQERRHD